MDIVFLSALRGMRSSPNIQKEREGEAKERWVHRDTETGRKTGRQVHRDTDRDTD